jgi:hypothetical protein
MGVALRACASPMERTTRLGDQWACLRHGVTFEHSKVLPWVLKGECKSVNEAVYTGVIESTGAGREATMV